MSNPSVRLALLMVVTLLVAASCSARPGKQYSRDIIPLCSDTVIRKTLGDSVCNIISDAKRIRAEVIKVDNGNTVILDGVNLKDKHAMLVKFVMSDPVIYKSNTPVYGSFMPCLALTFTRRDENCIAKFDLGLKKWALFDSKGACLGTFDLTSDNMQRVARIIFPSNSHLQSLVNFDKR